MDISCSICLETLVGKDDVSAVLCGHVFHTGCITSWIKEKKNCPQCRHPAAVYRLLRLFFERPTQGQAAPTLSAFLAVVADSQALKNKIADLEELVGSLQECLRESRFICSDLIVKHEATLREREEECLKLEKETDDWKLKHASQSSKNAELLTKLKRLREEKVRTREKLLAYEDQRKEYRRKLKFLSEKLSESRKKIRSYEKNRLIRRKKIALLAKQKATLRKRVVSLEKRLAGGESDASGKDEPASVVRDRKSGNAWSAVEPCNPKPRVSTVLKLYKKAALALTKQGQRHRREEKGKTVNE